MEKKCIFITPTGVSMRLKSGAILMPNSKTPAMATTKEILNALNGGIRVLEIVGTSQIRLDKSNYMMDFNNTAEANASKASAELNAIVEDIAKTLDIPVPDVNVSVVTVDDVKAATEAYEKEQETFNAIFGEAETKEPEEVPAEPEEVEEKQEDPEAKYYEGTDEPDTSDENEDELPKDEEEVTD